MPYVSAKYLPANPLTPDAPKQVEATDDEGQKWVMTEASQVGDWLRYLEEGGTIAPAEEPAPEPETKPAPESVPMPQPVESDGTVPRAQPDMVYDMPPMEEPPEELKE